MSFFIKSYKEDYSYNAENDKKDTKFCHSYSPLSTKIAIKNMMAETALPPIKTHNGMPVAVTNLPITIAPNVSLQISPVIFEIFSLCLFVSFTIKVYYYDKKLSIGGTKPKNRDRK
jgi:hypothetical protein